MTDDQTPTGALTEAEPSEAGWYAYSGGAQTMVFHLGDTGQWHVYVDNGSASECAWGYIEQALGVYDLVPIVLPPASPVLNPPDTLRRLVEQWGPESIYDAFITRWPMAEAALAEAERKGAREALLAAAGALEPGEPDAAPWAKWLRDRAAQIGGQP